MRYWPSLSWTANLSSSLQSPTTIAMDFPFALVGSHPSCQIQIDKLGTPDLVYVVFSFKDTIEVWPTAAIAFPQWGPLAPDQPLKVGGTQLYFQQQENENLGKNPNIERYHFKKTHIIDVDGRTAKKGRSLLLKHRVQIIGENHPSTLRIRDVGLRDCHQAIVAFDECCWQIDLRPNIVESARVKQVFVGDEMKIGELKAVYRTKNRKAKEVKPVGTAGSTTVIAPGSLDPKRENELGYEPEEYNESVADRLVKLNRTRTFRSKLIKCVLWLLLVAAAGGVLAWIAKELSL